MDLAVSGIIESLANEPLLRNPAPTWLWSSQSGPAPLAQGVWVSPAFL